MLRKDKRPGHRGDGRAANEDQNWEPIYSENTPQKQGDQAADVYAARLRRNNQWRSLRPKVLGAVLEKTDGRCFYCGISVVEKTFIDHFMPTNLGGSDHLSNLVSACGSCNSAKGPRLLSVWRRTRRWQHAESQGIPRFDRRQYAWLKSAGFDPLASIPIPIFWFERQGIPEPIDEGGV